MHENPRTRLVSYGVALLATVGCLLIRWPLWPVLGDAVPVVRAASMHDAVRAAAACARPGDTVLLSPACASFDWYSSYAERGDDFAREVASLRSAS